MPTSRSTYRSISSVGSSLHSTCCWPRRARARRFAVLFVNEREMAELNDSYMGKPGPTDVLAFPIDAAEAEMVHTANRRAGPIAHRPTRRYAAAVATS